MSNLKPIVIAVAGAVMLTACSSPAVRQPLLVQGVQRVNQNTEQSAASWYRLGKYHQERGQLSLAMGAYAQSLALDAGQLDARNAVAAIDAQQGRLADARDALQRLAADYPGEAQPLNNLGYVYYLMGDYPAAIATLQRAVAMDPNGRAYYNLVQAQTAARNGAPAGALAAAAAPAAPTVMPAVAPVAEAAPSRMDLVELAPNVLQLKLRASQAIAAVPALPAAAPLAVPPVRVMPTVAAPAVMPQAVAVAVAAAPAPTPAPKPAAVAATPVPAVASPAVAMVTPPAPAPAPKPVAATAVPTPAVTLAAVALAAAPSQAAAPKPAPVVATAAPAVPAMPVAVAAAPVPVVAPHPVAVAAAPAPAVTPQPVPVAVAAAVPATAAPRLEISNGNGVTGLAKRYRSVLGKLGILASRITNARPFHQQASVIQYRPGFAAQAANLQSTLPGRTALQQSATLTHADVRLLLGKDAPSQLAQAEQLQDGVRFVAVDTTR
jgi:Flp pilus assembly protein TadD